LSHHRLKQRQPMPPAIPNSTRRDPSLGSSTTPESEPTRLAGRSASADGGSRWLFRAGGGALSSGHLASTPGTPRRCGIAATLDRGWFERVFHPSALGPQESQVPCRGATGPTPTMLETIPHADTTRPPLPCPCWFPGSVSSKLSPANPPRTLGLLSPWILGATGDCPTTARRPAHSVRLHPDYGPGSDLDGANRDVDVHIDPCRNRLLELDLECAAKWYVRSLWQQQSALPVHPS